MRATTVQAIEECQENIFCEEEVEKLTQDLVQMENALTEERIKARKWKRNFTIIQLLYHEISSAKDVNEIYQVTVNTLAKKLGFDRAILFKEQEETFTPVAVCGYSSKDLKAKFAHTLLALLAKQKKSVLINSDKGCCPQEYESDFQVKYFIAIPFSVHDNVNYILFAGNQTEDPLRRPPLTPLDLETLQILSNQIAVVIGKVELYNQTCTAARETQIQAQQLKQTLYQLQQTQAQLIQTEKMSSLGQLVAGVAHEVNNPVSFIAGNLYHAEEYFQDLLKLVQLYQQEYPNPTAKIQAEVAAIGLDYIIEDVPKMLESMQMGTERIHEITQLLRNFSRVDEAERKQVDIHTGLESTLMILQHRLKAKSERSAIELVKEYGELPKVECYPGQLNQVFMNLIANAIDALEQMRSEEITGKEKSDFSPMIRIRTEVVSDQAIAVRIGDNGTGISESVINRVFDPFFTTKPVGQGTGLGLSISYSIITQKHNGKLKCLSQPGLGAEFVIEIPLKQS